MNDEDFVRSILLAPQDSALRLVYADWLEERGDPRGEYLRVQAALAALPPEGAARGDAEAGLSELAARLPLAWLAQIDSPAAWNRLRGLAGEVRQGEVFPEAWAAVRQTMERVRQNVETLAPRLRELGYRFAYPERVHVPPPANAPQMIADIEGALGPMPLSFRAFHEIVGSVDFRQDEDQLVPWNEHRRKFATEVEILGEEDPLQVMPLAPFYEWVTQQVQDGGQVDGYWQFADDEHFKSGCSGGEGYHVIVPNPGADFPVAGLFIERRGEKQEWFVDYLRSTFRGGGFRGRIPREGDKQPPHTALIEKLREGLAPV